MGSLKIEYSIGVLEEWVKEAVERSRERAKSEAGFLGILIQGTFHQKEFLVLLKGLNGEIPVVLDPNYELGTHETLGFKGRMHLKRHYSIDLGALV